MTNTTVRLFVGDPIEEPSEKAFISRLRVDLERLGLRATLYANFFPAANKPRQVDVLVQTGNRTMHVEIKSLRPDYPVRASLNGPWVQLLPDGTERALESNGGRQALDGTFAISDAMRDLVRDGHVHTTSVDFKRYIDTVVGMWEDIPDGSDVEVPPYVTACGYDELLQRLSAPGPSVPWGDDEWDTFVLRLNLYQPEAESEPELLRRTQLEAVGDYRQRAQSFLAEGLGTFVDIGATDGDGIGLSASEIDIRVSNGRAVAVVGPSGSGKTFLSQHIAREQVDGGRLVIWLRAGAYETGRFREFIAQAMGPFSVETWRALIDAAAATGTQITVVVDGFNECPAGARGELLERLSAFLLRCRASVLVTSTTSDGLQSALGAEIFRIGEPDEHARLEILRAHGARDPNRISNQFRTPYELSISARCEQDLPEGASGTEVEAAYIRQFAPSERVRSGLRALASRMHSRLRTSIPLLAAAQVLNVPDLGLRASQVDAVLDCRLLAVDQHRLRFRHELLGQFLAAEDLVYQSDSGESLGQLLSAPANAVLAAPALRIESDHQRAWRAVTVLAHPGLVFAAATGAFGPEVAQLARDEIRRVLRFAVAETVADSSEFDREDGWIGRWVTERKWTDWERSLFAGAGRSIARGALVDEVCELIDSTDRVCRNRAAQLQADGDRQPISSVVSATYTQMAARADGRSLAASYVAKAFELARMGRRFGPERPPAGLARRLSAEAGKWSWGRYYLATFCVRPDDTIDQEFFGGFMRAAWDAGGYHLRPQSPRRSQVLL